MAPREKWFSRASVDRRKQRETGVLTAKRGPPASALTPAGGGCMYARAKRLYRAPAAAGLAHIHQCVPAKPPLTGKNGDRRIRVRQGR